MSDHGQPIEPGALTPLTPAPAIQVASEKVAAIVEAAETAAADLQAVTAGSEVTELMDRLGEQGEVTEQYFVHGLGVQTAEGLTAWVHASVRNGFGIEPGQGRRYSWGYPACPDQSEHEKVFRLLGAESIGLSLSHGHAVEPEQ